MPMISDIISDLQKQRESANKANLARFKQAQSLYDRIIGQYELGGTFGQGVEARLGRLRTQTLASGMQNLVSSGFANTTMAAGLSGKFAEEVAAPTMMQLEDLRTTKLSAALEGKANLLGMMEDVGPSSDLIAQLASQYQPATSIIRTTVPGQGKFSRWMRGELEGKYV
jgi:hypothetical protein